MLRPWNALKPGRLSMVAVTLMAVAGIVPTATYADTLAQAAAVTISDSGFSPETVNLTVGGTVVWTNSGANVHTATSTNNPAQHSTSPNPAPYDSGGLGPGQSFSFVFPQAGTWIYSSYPDCMAGNRAPGFSCTMYTINVGAALPAGPGATPLPIPLTVPVGPTVNQNATVAINESGFSPAQVSIVAGGSINFVNQGSNVHTAVSGKIQPGPATLISNLGPVLSSAPPPFDTGGLAPGESKGFQFPVIGTYTYSSATDCQNGNNNPTFNCSGPYTINVVIAPVGAVTQAAAPPFSGPTVYIRDSGFDPPTITAKAGQTVTWLSLSTTTHSVASLEMSPPVDSGGLNAGATFTVTFQNPGTYHYSSSADPLMSGKQVTGSKFNGTVVVQ